MEKVIITHNKKEYKKVQEKLEKSGFEMLTPTLVHHGSNTSSRMLGGKGFRVTAPNLSTIYASSGNEQPVDNVGTKGLGWMEWGDGNRLPNAVSLATNLLPYTAAGWKFNTDTVAGLGPEPVYTFSRYSGGTIVTKDIPFHSAGQLLKNEIKNLQKELIGFMKEENKTSAVYDIIKSIEEQIKEREDEYDSWKTTNEELSEFIKNNNLDLIFLQLFGDEQMFGVCFPELLLSQNGSEKSTETWKPKITGIGYRPAHICRFERMDKDNRINYVYISNRWYDNPVISAAENNEIAAIPALDSQHPVSDLENKIRKARIGKVSVNHRPTRFILPSYYPTVGRPYYPQPAWHSIFGGDIYDYADTIITDRLNRRKNSNIIGRVIYIHSEYLSSLYVQREANTEKKKEELRNEILHGISEWLSNPDNSGQSLLAFNFIGRDGKEHKSFEILELESQNKNTVVANEKELSEISSVILFSQEINPELVGAIPGYQGSSGGTYLREMYLLKQMKMVPTQNIVIKSLQVISRFNNWDSHLKWKIKQQVMTTLDNSKTGLTEQ